MLTWRTERCSSPGPVVATWLGSFVRKSVVTAVVEHISVVDERSHVETRPQCSVLDLWHLALACHWNIL